MDRTEKAEAVSSLNATLASAASVVVVRNLGMTVAQSTVLRQQMRDAGADFRVTKNRLAKIALDGTSYTGIGELLTGPTALATSTDPVSAAKIAVEFAKTNDKLEIVGGGMGDVVLDVNGVKALASLPSLDELRARSSVWCRLRPPRLRRLPQPRRASWRGFLAHMPPKKQRDFELPLKLTTGTSRF